MSISKFTLQKPAADGLQQFFRIFRPVLLAIMLLTGGYASAQVECTLVCNGTDPNSPDQISVGDNCLAGITPDAVLEDIAGTCPGPKRITIRTLSNVQIARDTDLVVFDASPYINTIVKIEIFDLNSGNRCEGFYMLMDKQPPRLTCTDLTVACTADTSARALGFPAVVDNCSDLADIRLRYEDEVDASVCSNDTLMRRWIAVDKYGNGDTCVQRIILFRPRLQDIVFPRDTTLNCVNPNTDTSSTGSPTYQGKPVKNNSFCNFTFAFADERVSNCGPASYQLVRTWTIIDHCNSGTRTHRQVIRVADTTPPVITCPPNLTVGTDPNLCTATVGLPRPRTTDDCSGTPTISVTTNYGQNSIAAYEGVPLGTYMVRYTATDACGNTSTCSVTLTVEDRQAPVAVCDKYTVVSIPTSGIAEVKAVTFDDLSRDNCATELFFKVANMRPNTCNGANGDDAPATTGYQEWFDDYIAFCCEQIGEPDDTVILRVYQIDPGKGPVNPTREAPGGDLFGQYSQCMVRVEVQDKLPPMLTCPANVTVDCREDLYNNLERFGSPVIQDNCSFTTSSSVVRNIQASCGTGNIQRVFTATDPRGLTASCVQTVYVVNERPLRLADITWPKDTTFWNVCAPLVNPDDLPAGYNRPVIKGPQCGTPAIRYKDEVFSASFPACYKVLRHWTIIDWCRYEPGNPASGGIFETVQTIKVMDHEAPELRCPAPMIVGIEDGCSLAPVTFAPLAYSDCNPNIAISNDSRYATSKGLDASGRYPVGTTTVVFRAEDGCGNVSTCSTTVTISDTKAPSPLCIVGLSANLANMGGQIMTTVWAKDFDAGSSDNCTDRSKLKFTIRKHVDPNPTTVPTADHLDFTCADLGTLEIEIWATDESGKSGYCVTEFTVQDLNRLCAGSGSLIVSGSIRTESGLAVPGVELMLNNNEQAVANSNTEGKYEIKGLLPGKDYSVLPRKKADARSGISTIDLVMITRHILRVETLQSPYKLIAADVDHSGAITASDLVQLRRLLLGIITELPGGTSWRFVDADYRFPDPANPFLETAPEVKSLNNLVKANTPANFIAFKLGDINGSVFNDANALGIENRSDETLKLEYQPERTARSDEWLVPVFAGEDLAGLDGFQFTLQYDAGRFELLEISAGDLPEFGDQHFGTQMEDQGLLNISWNGARNSVAVKPGQRLLQLRLRTVKAYAGEPALDLTSAWLKPEAYVGMREIPVQLNLKHAAGKDDFALLANKPNPFREETIIGFQLPEAGQARLSIFDAAGRLIFVRKDWFEAGYHEVSVQQKDLGMSGLFFYRLETEGNTATRKMILSE